MTEELRSAMERGIQIALKSSAENEVDAARIFVAYLVGSLQAINEEELAEKLRAVLR